MHIPEYEDVNELTEAQAKKALKALIAKLDAGNEDDQFGTEGWRHTIMGED